MKTLTRTCHCGEEFTRKKYEIERVEKKGGTPCCSRSCSVAKNNKAKTGKPLSQAQLDSNRKNLAKINNVNPYPGMARLFAYCNRKDRNKGCDFDLDYLNKLWEKQDDKCAYTGIELTLPKGHRSDPRFLASIDRIDSNIGYLKGNVQVVSTCINLMKTTLSHEEVLEFLDILRVDAARL